jgi:hypothetical protein
MRPINPKNRLRKFRTVSKNHDLDGLNKNSQYLRVRVSPDEDENDKVQSRTPMAPDKKCGCCLWPTNAGLRWLRSNLRRDFDEVMAEALVKFGRTGRDVLRNAVWPSFFDHDTGKTMIVSPWRTFPLDEETWRQQLFFTDDDGVLHERTKRRYEPEIRKTVFMKDGFIFFKHNGVFFKADFTKARQRRYGFLDPARPIDPTDTVHRHTLRGYYGSRPSRIPSGLSFGLNSGMSALIEGRHIKSLSSLEIRRNFSKLSELHDIK